MLEGFEELMRHWEVPMNLNELFGKEMTKEDRVYLSKNYARTAKNVDGGFASEERALELFMEM